MAKQATAKPVTAIALIGRDRTQVGALFNKVAPTLARILPDGVDAKRLGEIAIVTLRKTPKLSVCTQASFFGAIVECGKLGLYPDVRGHAFLIPRRTGPINPATNEKTHEAHFQPGYQGLLELCRRSGMLTVFECRPVYAKDEFFYEYGTQPFMKHTPFRDGPAGELVAAYATCILKGAPRATFHVVEAWEIEQLKQSIKPRGDSPWLHPLHQQAMWMKTAAIRLLKYLPWSTEQMQRAVALDEMADANIAQHLGEDYAEALDDFSQGEADGMEVTADDLVDAEFTATKDSKPEEGAK